MKEPLVIDEAVRGSPKLLYEKGKELINLRRCKIINSDLV